LKLELHQHTQWIAYVMWVILLVYFGLSTLSTTYITKVNHGYMRPICS
jgi:hypothetical protein